MCRPTRLVKVPKAISDEQAAAMMLKGLTAQYLLRRTYRVQEGRLDPRARGRRWRRPDPLPVGTRARREGDRRRRQRRQGRAREEAWLPPRAGHAAATTSSSRCARLTKGAGVAVVYDSVGKDTFFASLDCLRAARHDGDLRQRVGPAAAVLAARTLEARLAVPDAALAVRLHREARATSTRRARTVRAVVLSGEVQDRIGQRYPLADAAKAHRDLEARRTTGSTVLLP